jgi:hypothetical protein
MYLRHLFFVALLVVLVACSPSTNNQNTQTNISATVTEITTDSTVRSLPSSTPRPSATPLPSRLETMPESFNLGDVTVVADSFAFQITRTYTLAQLNDWTPPENKTYFIMEGILFNYSEIRQEFFRTNFELETVSGEKILPNLDLMAALQTSQYPELDYPGQRHFLSKALPIDAYSWQNTFLVYEMPTPIEKALLHFTPLDRPTASSIEMWFLVGDTQNELRVFEAYDNAVQQYELEFNFDNQETIIEDIIDEQVITVDNCFGTEVIDRSRQFSESTEVFYTFGFGAAAGAGLGTGIGVGGLLLNSIIGDIVGVNFSLNYQVNQGDSITETIEETLRAAPATITNYQLTWYRVTVQGMMRLRLGGENFYVPYSLTNRLRADVVSLPAGLCPESTQDN